MGNKNFIEYTGYAPDANPLDGNVLVRAVNVSPSVRGWEASRYPRTASFVDYTAFPMDLVAGYPEPVGAAWMPEGGVNYSRLFYVAGYNGTFKLIELLSGPGGGSGGQVAREVSTGLLYSAVVMGMFGGHTVASTPNRRLMTRSPENSTPFATSPGFATLGFSPLNVAFMLEISRFLLCVSCSVPTDVPYLVADTDRWVCSARDDHTSWTLSPSTLCATGRLPDSDGGFTGAGKLGEEAYLFKRNGVYRGRYVPNSTEVFEFERAPIAVGSGGPPINYRGALVWAAAEGVFHYDGSNLTNLLDGTALREWQLFADMQIAPRLAMDEARQLIYIQFKRNDRHLGSAREMWLCHVPTKRWATIDNSNFRYGFIFSGDALYPNDPYKGYAPGVPAKVPYVFRGPMQYTGYGPDITANDRGWVRPMILDGPPPDTRTSVMQTGYIGDPFKDVEVTQVDVGYLREPTGSSTMMVITRNKPSADPTYLTPVPLAEDGHYDVNSNARWHQFEHKIVGDFELTGLSIQMGARGKR